MKWRLDVCGLQGHLCGLQRHVQAWEVERRVQRCIQWLQGHDELAIWRVRVARRSGTQ